MKEKGKIYALLLRSKLKITKIEDYKNFLQKFKITKIEDYKNLAQLQHSFKTVSQSEWGRKSRGPVKKTC